MANELTGKITGFINAIGITCRPDVLTALTFLPGIDIQQGCIVYDCEQMKYPGDLLHEAGHLAVLLPNDRAHAQSPDRLFGDLDAPGAELGAIAWSWAALQHLELLPEIVFHDHGYKGGSKSLIENFSQEKYFAVPLLQWFGMTHEPKENTAPDEYTFPKMKHWLRQEVITSA